VEELLTMPFFGGGKLVWLKQANFLADNVMGRSETVLSALESLSDLLAKGLPPDVTFVLSATEVDKRRSFPKTLAKLGTVQTFDRLDTTKAGWEDEAEEICLGMASDRGIRFDPDAMKVFAVRTAGNPGTIAVELEKLALYAGEPAPRITEAAVRLMTPVSRSGAIFDLSNALQARQLPASLTLLRQLLGFGDKPIMLLLVVFIPAIRNLLMAKELVTRHKIKVPQSRFGTGKIFDNLPADAIKHLPRKKDGGPSTYPIALAAAHAHRFTVAQLQAAMVACLDANLALVSSTLDPEIVLTQLTVRICAH
jgi:DNA polymerase-3 subunit delta